MFSPQVFKSDRDLKVWKSLSAPSALGFLLSGEANALELLWKAILNLKHSSSMYITM